MTNETRSTKRSLDPAYLVLTLIGIMGLALFILACRPSWSPDGQKVLYSYWDDGSNKAAVAVFDRKTRTSRVIFEWWDETTSGPRIVASQWTKDGDRAIVMIYEEEGVQLLALPMNSHTTAQAYTLKKMDEMSPLPFPEVGKNLFLIAGKVAIRINLETGEMFRKEYEEDQECLLYDAGDKVFYMREIKAKEPEAKKDGAAKTETKEQGQQAATVEAYELGELDQKDLGLQPWLTLRTEELKAKGIGEPTGFVDVSTRNFALVTPEDPLDGKSARLLVIGKSGIEQTLDVGIKEKSYKLGNPQWSRNEKTIFVAALIEDEKAKRSEFAVVEVSVDGKSTRIDRIEERPSNEFDSDYLSEAQIALSPDGKLIAVTNGHLEDVRPERRGLFLLDVSKRERPVSFYPAPALPAAQKKKE